MVNQATQIAAGIAFLALGKIIINRVTKQKTK